MPYPRRTLLGVSALLAMMPVTFGVIRALRTGDDVRYLWLAGASLLGSWMIAAPLGRGEPGPRRASVARALTAVALGALCAGVTAVLLGASAGAGVAIVAVAFGLCTGTSVMFAMLARRPQTL